MTPMTTGTDFPTQPRMHTDQIHATPIRSPTSAPNSLELNGTSIFENQPAGTIIGQLSATDPDAYATLSYAIVDANGSPLSLDANGTLRALVSFDFETNLSSHSIRVKVTDEHNASLESNFTITILNQVEDLDGDGIEDHYDSDDDGDGFSDASEIAYGSDPMDFNSVANAAPTSLELNGSTLFENQPIGTLVGRLFASDPDANASLSFTLVQGEGSEDNQLFYLEGNTLRSQATFDYEASAAPPRPASASPESDDTHPAPPGHPNDSGSTASNHPQENASSGSSPGTILDQNLTQAPFYPGPTWQPFPSGRTRKLIPDPTGAVRVKREPTGGRILRI